MCAKHCRKKSDCCRYVVFLGSRKSISWQIFISPPKNKKIDSFHEFKGGVPLDRFVIYEQIFESSLVFSFWGLVDGL